MKLSQFLATNNLSRRSLAERAGVARTTIMRLLDHGMVPQHATAQKLVAATEGLVSEAELAAEAAEVRSTRNREAA